MLIETRSLTKTFGALRANDRLSLRFAGGRIHGVLGENGAGKSTLMKLLSGFLRSDSGEILLDGQHTQFAAPGDALRAGVGMVHQDPLDVPAFNALENFYCAAPRWALPTRAEARATLLVLAKRLGFTVAPTDLIASLTVGQRQQLEIMRLLACGARALILDEPTTGITAPQKVALFAALKQLAAEGNTVLFVSHKLEEVAELCSSVSILRAGRLVGEQLPMPQPHERLLALMFGDSQPDEQESGVRDQEPAIRGEWERGGVGDEAEHRRLKIADSNISTLYPLPSTLRATPSPLQRFTPSGTPTWQLDGITLREGPLELRGLTFAIQPGSVLGLAGLDGSGQQLLLRLLSGGLRPLAGRLHLLGKDVSLASAAAFRTAGVQYLPADRLADGVIGAFSLTDHLALQATSGGLLNDTASARRAAQTAIAEYAIKATPDTPIAALSGGNQQRVMLALLPAQCAGILFDQPTRGLDVASARAIWGRLLARRATGTALVFASADLDEVLEYSDHVLVFFGGQVSAPLPRASLNETRLAELIGGVGFVAGSEQQPPTTDHEPVMDDQ